MVCPRPSSTPSRIPISRHTPPLSLGMPVAGFGFAERGKPPTSDEVAAALGEYYNFVIDAFGCDRCMWESNFPVVRFGIGSKAGSLWRCLNPGAGTPICAPPCQLSSHPHLPGYPRNAYAPSPLGQGLILVHCALECVQKDICRPRVHRRRDGGTLQRHCDTRVPAGRDRGGYYDASTVEIREVQLGIPRK